MKFYGVTSLCSTLLLLLLVDMNRVNSQDTEDDDGEIILCPDNPDLSCNDPNKYLIIQSIEIIRDRHCETNCFIRLTENQRDRVAGSCEKKSGCSINFHWISDAYPELHFSCPRNNPGRGPPSDKLRVKYTCEFSDTHDEDFKIKEETTQPFRLPLSVPQNILSPSYPEMSTGSQDITCTFTRPSPRTRATTSVHVEVKELQLYDSAEILEIIFDSKIRDFPGPITILETIGAEQRIFDYDVSSNVTLHFNRCTTLPPGGRFLIAVKVESDFEVTCTHIFTNCESVRSPSPPPPLPGPDHIDPTDKPDNIGLIVGGIIGGLLLLVLLLVIIIVVLLFIIRKRRKNQDLPVEKRDKRHPPVARYSSYGDRTSNIYLEIADNDPSIHYYSEIGRINSALGKKKTDYDNRPPPEIPYKPNGANNNDPGYDKIKDLKTKGSDEDLGEIGNDYTTPIPTTPTTLSYEKIGDVEDKECSENSYSKLMNAEKKVTFEEQEDDGDIKAEYAKPNRKSEPDNNENDEGVDVESHTIDFKRANSEVIMQDNTDIYIPADEVEGFKAEAENTKDTPKGNNETANAEETKWHENKELYGSKC